MNRAVEVLLALSAAATIWYVGAWSMTAPVVPPAAPLAPVAPLAAKGSLTVYSTTVCAPCTRLKETLADPSVRQALAGWDVREIKGPRLARAAGVKAFPTVVAARAAIELARFEGYKTPTEFTGWLAGLPAANADGDQFGASVGGQVGPDGKTEIACDLPGNLHRKNTASKGLGNCVFTSIHHAALWQNVPALQEFPKYLIDKGIPGGGYPGKVDKLIPQIAKDRNLPVPQYLQVEGGDLEILKLACKAGRMPAVTYSRSPTGRYGGQRISHMVNIVCADDNFFVILDNNYPGSDKYEWLSPSEFSKAYAPGWAVVLLDPPPPPPPKGGKP